MKIGDTVRFIGDKNQYIVSFQRILNRSGVVVSFSQEKGNVNIRWMPKTKRGGPEFCRHKITELEVINTP